MPLQIILLLIALPVAAQSDCGPNIRCGQVPWQLPVMPVLVSPTPLATTAPQLVQPTQESAFIPAPVYCYTPDAPTQSTTYRQVVANTRPTGYWPMDETSGTTAADASGGGRTGTYTGATLNGYSVAGGGAPSFDGVNDRMSVSNIGSLLNSGAFSVSLWMRVATNWSGSGMLAYLAGNEFSLARVGGSIVLTSGTSSAAASASANGTAWVHVAAVVNRAVMGGQSARLYINGVSAATNNNAPGSFSVGTPLYIASTNTGSWFAGSIAHVAVYNRGLAADEVSLLANGSPAAAPTSTPNPGCTQLSEPGDLLDTSGIDNLWEFMDNMSTSTVVGVTNPQPGFDLYAGGVTFFSYVLGIQSINLGILTPVVTFLFWSFFTFVGVRIAFLLLPVLALIIGIIRKIIAMVRGGG